MRTISIIAWLMVGILFIPLHFYLKPTTSVTAEARQWLDKAQALEASAKTVEDWTVIADYYDKCRAKLDALPEDEDVDEDLVYTKNQSLKDRLGLSASLAKIRAGQLDQAIADLELIEDNYKIVKYNQQQELVSKGSKEKVSTESDLMTQVKLAMAQAHYYSAILKRKEGVHSQDWLQDTQRASELYRTLAQQQAKNPDKTLETQRCVQNLEKTIQLAQMDQEQLALARIPKKAPSQRNGPPRKGPGKGKKKKGPGKGPGKPGKDGPPVLRSVKIHGS